MEGERGREGERERGRERERERGRERQQSTLTIITRPSRGRSPAFRGGFGGETDRGKPI